jgi:hypothetical protein
MPTKPNVKFTENHIGLYNVTLLNLDCFVNCIKRDNYLFMLQTVKKQHNLLNIFYTQ